MASLFHVGTRQGQFDDERVSVFVRFRLIFDENRSFSASILTLQLGKRTESLLELVDAEAVDSPSRSIVLMRSFKLSQ
jgi:hypothetical protein